MGELIGIGRFNKNREEGVEEMPFRKYDPVRIFKARLETLKEEADKLWEKSLLKKISSEDFGGEVKALKINLWHLIENLEAAGHIMSKPPISADDSDKKGLGKNEEERADRRSIMEMAVAKERADEVQNMLVSAKKMLELVNEMHQGTTSPNTTETKN